jgi:hypothetical protein
MKSLLCWLRRQVAAVLVIVLAMPLAEGAAAMPRQAASAPQRNTSLPQSQPKDSDSQAGNPATVANAPEGTYPDSPAPKPLPIANQSGQVSSSQSGAEQSQNSTTKPVGTAAAPYEKTTGVAAGKQRRARSILIRVGVVVGAAVAVGTVVALSRASPSRPN